MIKLASLAAVAAVALAGQASAAEIRIPVAGKSQAQIEAEIRRAARSVCKEQALQGVHVSAFARCIETTLQDAKPQLARLSAR